MKKHLLISLVAIIVGVLAGNLRVSAQNVSLPYQMNFESNETAELANWVLNPGADASEVFDQWVVGNSVHSAGRQALYISNNGQDAMFDTVPCVQYAYRDMILPAGTCILTFDWFCIGGPSSSLYVGVGDFSACTLEANTKGAIPNTIKNPVGSLMTFSNWYGSESWTNASYTFTSDGMTPTRLVFAWENKNRDRSACTIGACIDNIVITNTRCKRPSNISASVISCDSVYVSWTGNSQAYEVNYRMVGTSTWVSETRFTVNPTDFTKISTYVTNVDEGSLEIRVRGICTPDTSAWMYGPEVVVFCPERHCVNFTDLAASTVTCTYGETNRSYADPADRAHAYDHVGIVDFGSESILSRHTVNWDKTATDPRTGGVLPLIPKGGYASVRLGNWEDGNGAESITYEYVVDSSNAVVLMQYAVVLEDPDGHGDDSPRFLLEILDENNNLLEPTCGVRNFVATDVDRNEWRTYYPDNGSSYYSTPVVWKPWTTVGLNLTELGVQDGQVIRVRLTTFDCFWSAHYGYAYFTLDCAKATIESASCAKDAGAGSMTLVAPEGFSYQWYDKYNNALPGQTTRIYEPNDTATYRCRLTSTENSACYFDLYSACVPRLPAPEFTYEHRVELCQHKIDINNRSHSLILVRNDTLHDRTSRCDEHLWMLSGTLNDGTSYGPIQSSAYSPLLTLPGQGGHFTLSLKATLIGGCDSTIVTTFDLEDVAIRPDTIQKTLCRPVNKPTEPAWLDEISQWIPKSGLYPVTYIASNGCDSVIVYDVKVGNTYNICLGDTLLCYGEKLTVGNTTYDSSKKPSGQWGDFSLKTPLGCDSVVYYNVTVSAPIKPIISCGDEVLSLPFSRVELENGKVAVDLKVKGEGFDTYTLSYSDGTGKHADAHTPADSLLNDMPVNEYIFTFSNADGCEQRDTVLVGGDTLCLNLLTQIQCACGKPVLDFPYHKCEPANKARLASCSVKFSEADKTAQGFEDVTFTTLKDIDTIHIPVPAGAEPGVYDIDLIFDTVVGGCIWGQNAFHTAITLTYDSSVIFHRWTENAIISLAGSNKAKKADGSDYALYSFSDFQWLRNGLEVEGETRSYMEQPGTLDMNDAFALRMLRADGQLFTTCLYIPGHNSVASTGSAPAASVAPSDPMAGAPVALSLTDEAEVEIYSVMGSKVFAGHFAQGMSSFAAPAVPGMYIINVRMRGEVTTLRIRVR